MYNTCKKYNLSTLPTETNFLKSLHNWQAEIQQLKNKHYRDIFPLTLTFPVYVSFNCQPFIIGLKVSTGNLLTAYCTVQSKTLGQANIGKKEKDKKK